MKRAREMAGMSQQDLADLLHCDQSVIARWEGGKRPVPQDVQQTIKNYLQSRLAKRIKNMMHLHDELGR